MLKQSLKAQGEQSIEECVLHGDKSPLSWIAKDDLPVTSLEGFDHLQTFMWLHGQSSEANLRASYPPC